MKNKNMLPLPLQITKELSTLYPYIYDKCDYILEGKGKDLPDWNDICIIPIAATNSIQSVYKHKVGKYYDSFAPLTQAVYAWRKYKEIYSFDTDLSRLLIEQADDIVIPNDILLSLPYPCIYISCQYQKYDGFFVCFECDAETFNLELRITLVNKKFAFPLWLHLREGNTIRQSIEEGVEFSQKNIKSGNVANVLNQVGISAINLNDSYETDDMFKMLSELIQFVLYICADNSDITENEEQKQYTRKPKNTTNPTDTFREIRKWDIGFRVGNSIRKNYSQNNISNERISKGSHTPKRPHTRCGHWHHFWTGSDKNNSKNIILKWVAPMFINCDDENDGITTEHNVK